MADGDEILSYKGGVREIKYKNSDYQVLEVGENSLRGFSGEPPTGRRSYIAARQARASRYGSIVVRVRGTLSLYQNDARYNPSQGDQTRWMSRRVLKSDVEDRLWAHRLDEGGTGAGEHAYLNVEGDQGAFPNTYIRTVSELTGWNWDTVDVVQFMSEPEKGR